MLMERIEACCYCVDSRNRLVGGERGGGRGKGTREMYRLGQGSRLWRAC